MWKKKKESFFFFFFFFLIIVILWHTVRRHIFSSSVSAFMKQLTSLKIGSLNIQGSTTIKCETLDIQQLIKRHHIFVIEESWLEKHDKCPKIPSYATFRTERKKHPKAKRNSGGIIIYVNHTIVRGVTKVMSRANKGGDAIWIKLDKSHFGLNTDIYLCGAYVIPRADDDVFEILRKEIEMYSSMGKVCLIGDLNSRMSNSQPNHYSLETDTTSDLVSALPVPTRQCMDTTTNSNGNKLISLLTNYDMLVANGFIMGDLEGKLTCSSYNGFSTNDMFLFHRDLYNQVNYFKVDDDFQWYSDHKAISASLQVKLQLSHRSRRSWSKLFKNKMYWDDSSICKYKEILSEANHIEEFRAFTSNDFGDSNEAVTKFTSIMSKILTKVFPSKHSRRQKSVSKTKNESSHVCRLAKRAFKQAQRQLKIDITSVDRRHRLIIERRNYRRAIYSTKKIFKENKINKLLELEHSDTKSFWKGLKSIISPRDDSVENIDKNEWTQHFDNVLNVPAARGSDNQFLEYVKSSLPTLEENSIVNDMLNHSISHEEICSTIKELKSGKAVFTDNIGNEALKHGYVHLKESLYHMFNVVFRNGDFPNIWADGIIIPLHKKEDKMNVNNYRGIIISSCVSKVLLRILTKRIDSYMSQSGKWSIHQCGFKKDHRTEDNLFLLNTIHEKYVKNMKKDVYIAFIDFSKFFDKINRDMMLYKLLKYNINGPIYKIIKSVYSRTGYKVKIGDDVSPLFYGQNGLKQGCCMSPSLSSIYQNDLHDMFGSPQCDPVKLDTTTLNSVSWADDLILMSLSQNGLQNCVNKLVDYCKRWGLEINESKTKCMVMTNKRGPFEPIYIYDKQIEYVKQIRYLGFHVKYNGNVDSIIQDRIAKASKVSHMVLQALRTNINISSELALKLFDKQIVPILLYGCPVWCVPKTQNLIYLEGQPENLNTRNIVNSMLSSTLNRTVPFDYARRVGKRPANNGPPRKILIKLGSYSDKMELFSALDDSVYHISKFYEYKDDIEKVHHDYCKKSLNISKYASSTAVQGELGRKPIINIAKGLAIKYWLRLHFGTENKLLNECYTTCLQNNHSWIQGIQGMLFENGFGEVYVDPVSIDKEAFHKYFRSRLDDQYVQNWNSKIRNSNRFTTLQKLSDNYEIKPYIHKVKDPYIRKIFTRLRIDMNLLKTSKSQGVQQNIICSFCTLEPETVDHFLLRCTKYQNIRSQSFNMIASYEPEFENWNDTDKLKCILDLKCSDTNVGVCCNFLSKIYKTREIDHSL